MVTVYLPSPLRRMTGGRSKLQAQGANVGEVLEALERQYPGIRQQVCDEAGEVRSFINVFVNGTEIRQLQGLATLLREADELSIIPAMAGGVLSETGRRAVWARTPEGSSSHLPTGMGETAWPAK